MPYPKLGRALDELLAQLVRQYGYEALSQALESLVAGQSCPPSIPPPAPSASPDGEAEHGSD